MKLIEPICMGGYDQWNHKGKIYVLVRNGKKEKENWSKDGAGEAIEIERNLRRDEKKEKKKKRRDNDEREKIEIERKSKMDKWFESHWAPHSFGLVPHRSKELCKLL